jgi:hypothetical protein
MTDPTIYAEPENPALPTSGFELDVGNAASAIWTTAEAVALLKEGHR